MNKEKINPESMALPPAPYTNIIKVQEGKEMIFLSGISAAGKGSITEQTKGIVENILTTLKAAGAGPENIVMTTTYVLGDYLEEFLATRSCDILFEGLDNPADTLIGVANLAGARYGALIEVSVVAMK